MLKVILLYVSDSQSERNIMKVETLITWNLLEYLGDVNVYVQLNSIVSHSICSVLTDSNPVVASKVSALKTVA